MIGDVLWFVGGTEKEKEMPYGNEDLKRVSSKENDPSKKKGKSAMTGKSLKGFGRGGGASDGMKVKLAKPKGGKK